MRKTLLIVLAGLTSMACVSEVDTTGSLELVNGTMETIDEVYVATSGAASWGPQRNLSAVAPDGILTLSRIDSASWSVMAVVANAGSTYYGYVDDVPVAVGQTTSVTLYDSDFTGSVDVVNDDAYLTLADVWLSPAGQNDWSADVLGGTLSPGGWVEVVDLPPGDYDVQCRFTDDTYRFDSVTVTSLSIVDAYCYY